jgi:chromosome segregation ATPase
VRHATLAAELKEWQDKYDALHSAHQEAMGSIQEVHSHMQRVLNEHQDLSLAVQNHEKLQRDYEAKITQLSAQLHMAQHAHATAADQARSRELLEEINAAQLNEIEALKRDLSSAQEALQLSAQKSSEAEKKERTAVENERKAMKEKLKMAEAKYTDAQRSLDARNSQIQKEFEERQVMQAKIDAMTKAMNAEKASAERELGERIRALEERVEVEQAAAAAAVAAKRDAEDRLAAMSKELDALKEQQKHW